MFTSARLRLTLWYLVTLTVVVGLLSLVLYRILVRLQNAELQAVGPTQRDGIAQLFARDEGQLALQILALDAGVLILAALGAFVLAGRTLTPIAQAMERQHRFAASASHELRTPLTVLRSKLEVALLKQRSAEDYERTIRQAMVEVERMGTLATDLLELARVEHDADMLALGLLDLRDIIRDTLVSLRPLAAQKQMQLDAHVDRPLLVEGDAAKLRQALTTLVDNAVAYTPAGGHVDVTGLMLRTRVLVQVRDTGPGIAPEHLPHLFEPFYRADRARTGGSGHVGLGLALAEWIVRMHRGQLSVESHLGRGSVFTMSLPTAR